jgi:hypothetical protein
MYVSAVASIQRTANLVQIGMRRQCRQHHRVFPRQRGHGLDHVNAANSCANCVTRPLQLLNHQLQENAIAMKAAAQKIQRVATPTGLADVHHDADVEVVSGYPPC